LVGANLVFARFPYGNNIGRGESCIRPGSFNGADANAENENPGEHKVRPYGTADDSLGRVIQAFKSLTTLAYAEGVDHRTWTPFPGKLWQRNYYERVVRNDNELTRARDYIANNPNNWAQDSENPAFSP
jgi:putative transposase